MDIEERVKGSAWRWSLLFSVLVLNICLPNLILSYGVLVRESVEHGVPTWLGLTTSVIFILTYGLTQCWCREAADSWGGLNGYRVMAAIGLTLVVTSLLLCAFVPIDVQPYIYGILGGFGSSIISAQIDAVTFETYDTRLGIIRAICLAGQAVGQSFFPHIISALIEHYGYSYSYIVLSSVMLQTMPAVILLKVDYTIRRPVSYTRYSDLAKTYAIYSNDIVNDTYTNELQLHDLSKKCWRSPSDDNLHREDSGGSHTDEYTTITPPPSPEDRRRNVFGIDILPDILEETEESDDDDDDDYDEKEGSNVNKHKKRFSAAIKRLSTLGDNFDEYITKQIRRDSESERRESSASREYAEIEVTYDNIAPITNIQREKIMKSFSYRCQSAFASMRRRAWMPSYRVYRLRRRMFYMMYAINDTLVKPLTRSLSTWRFYPALMLSFTKLSLTAFSLVLMPMIASQVRPKISLTESNFLMSLHGFTWICFLLSTPWLTQTPKRNYKYVAVLGLLISTLACYVLSAADNHDLFSIGCVVAGLGFGAISACWEGAVQDFVGVRKWPKLQSTIETTSALLLALFFSIICLLVDLENNLQDCLFVLSIILTVVTMIWLIIAAVAIYKTIIRTALISRTCMNSS